VLVARDDGRIVGTVQFELACRLNQPHRAEVAKLLVHPSRSRGAARAARAPDARARISAARDPATCRTPRHVDQRLATLSHSTDHPATSSSGVILPRFATGRRRPRSS
jgi:hypothetical protein